MRARLFSIMCGAAMICSLGISGVASAATEGTVAHESYGTGPEAAAFVAQGCTVDVTQAVFEAVIRIKQYAGKTLRLQSTTSIFRFGGVGGVQAHYHPTCDATGLVTSTLAGTAQAGGSVTFKAKGEFLVITALQHTTVQEGFKLTVL